MNPILLFQEKNGLVSDGVIGKITLQKMQEIWKLSAEQLAHFLGQTHEESGGFTIFEENLNYSSVGLSKIFSKYFGTKELCNKYARNPSKIANIVYANRMGNGSVNSGDGWKHRGYGALQVTGKENQKLFSIYVNDARINDDPSLIGSLYAFESALWFFKTNNIFRYANIVNHDSILDVSRCVNVGNVRSTLMPINFEKRLSHTIEYYKLIKQ